MSVRGDGSGVAQVDSRRCVTAGVGGGEGARGGRPRTPSRARRGVVAREDVEERCADDARGSDDEGDALEGGLGRGGAVVLASPGGADRARPPPAHRGRREA
uniref:Uncharacterized protein n=1 Tax=Triticum urartu TaxID=4572 RepID=A0A8R7PXX8_TRIUA